MMKFKCIAILFALFFPLQAMADEAQETELVGNLEHLVQCQSIILTELRLTNIFLAQLAVPPDNVPADSITQLKTSYETSKKDQAKLFQLSQFVMTEIITPKAAAMDIDGETINGAHAKMLMEMDQKITIKLAKAALNATNLIASLADLPKHYSECSTWLGETAAP